jgi:hypothetical protein
MVKRATESGIRILLIRGYCPQSAKIIKTGKMTSMKRGEEESGRGKSSLGLLRENNIVASAKRL